MLTVKYWTVRGSGPWVIIRDEKNGWRGALEYVYQLPRRAHFVEVTLSGETRHYERGANYSFRRL